MRRTRPSPWPPRICALCGREFVPPRRDAKYCSRECQKRSWNVKRGAERAAVRERRERTILCACCGRPIAWTPLVAIKRYCSSKCRRLHEQNVRRVSRSRADAVRVRPAPVPPASLDALRGTRSDEYFEALFRLPMADQWAEMGLWTGEDHEAAAAYLGVRGQDGICGADGGRTAAGGPGADIEGSAERPPSAFDEEDHFGESF